MFTIVLEPWLMALAEKTAEDRPKAYDRPNPSFDPLSDLAGALSEHAAAKHFGLPPSAISAIGADDGWDMVVNGYKIDVKSSRLHPESWVIPEKRLKADWYLFAFVELPDTVVFKAKAPGPFLEKFEAGTVVPKRRLVRLPWLQDVEKDDFLTWPKRKD